MEQDIQKQLEALQQQAANYKIRLFDLQEELSNERTHVSQFVNILAQQLKIEGEDAQKLKNYIDAVQKLVDGNIQEVE